MESIDTYLRILAILLMFAGCVSLALAARHIDHGRRKLLPPPGVWLETLKMRSYITPRGYRLHVTGRIFLLVGVVLQAITLW